MCRSYDFSRKQHYRLGFASAEGTFYGADRTFVNAPSCTPNGAVVTNTSVTFSALVNPNGFAGPSTTRTNVKLWWQYGTVPGVYSQNSIAQAIGTGTSWVPVTVTRAKLGLTPSIYHYRVVISSTVGTTYGPDQTFSVKPPVVAYSLPVTTGSDATVLLTVNPNALDTRVSIQYGSTTAYTSGTLPGQDVGDGLSVPLSGVFTGLVPNTLYHYRVVTTNALGTVYGPDQTLATQPMYGTAAVASPKDAAPGITGATFGTFGNPAINDSDRIAFQAIISGSTGSGINSTNNSGIWADVGPNPRILIVRTGSGAPWYDVSRTNVGTFAKLSDPVYRNNDAVAFVGTLAQTGTVTATSNSGIWTTVSGSLVLVARTGYHAPDASGSTSFLSPVFASFSQLELPNQAGVVFMGNLVIGTSGVVAANNQGIWAQTDLGMLRQVIRKGDVLMVNGKARTVSLLTIFNTPATATGQTRHFTASGDLLFKIGFIDGSAGILKAAYPFTTQPATVVFIKDAAASVPGATFSVLGNPAINDSMHVAFQATVSGSLGSGIGATNNVGIWADSGSNGRFLIARTGASAPGYVQSGSAAGTFATLSDPLYANDDAVAFLGTLVKTGTTASEINATNNTGIWATVSGSLALLARAKDRAPDANGTTTLSSPLFASFAQVVLPNQGGVVFLAKLLSGTGGVVAATDGASGRRTPTEC